VVEVRIHKAERAPVEEILNAEAQDLDEVVEQVFDRVTDLMLSRDWYVIRAVDDHMAYHWGPYESEAKAKKALGMLVSPGPEPLKASIVKMYRIKEES